VSQILHVVAWWLALQVFALAAMPITFRVFRRLPDRGWTVARAVGLIALGYPYWLGGTFGWLTNGTGAILGTLIAVAIGSWTLLGSPLPVARTLLRERRALIVGGEILFHGAYLLWVIVRAFDPDITGTEKPMELLFLNGVLRSESFPPVDPWLSGSTISYYYFGYLLTAILAMSTTTPASIAFNLMLPTLFALSAVGAYGIGSALALARGASDRQAMRGGLLTSGCLLIVSNLEPVLEILNARRALPEGVRAFFAIKDMPVGYQAPGFFPSDNWWWFRATRVIGTPAPAGQERASDYTITEFPFFSFVLGDMHPHVLSLPFVLLGISFALAVLNEARGRDAARLWRDPWILGPLAIGVGALGFLNTWDLPTVLFVVSGAYALALLRSSRTEAPIARAIEFGAIGLVASLLTYAPFYLTFRSQAAGLGVVTVKSQLHHFLLFWGPVLIVAAIFLIVDLVRTWRGTASQDWSRSIAVWLMTAALSAIAIWVEAPAVALILPLCLAAGACASRVVRNRPPTDVEAPPPTRASREATSIAGSSVGAIAPLEAAFVFLLAFTAFLLLFGSEVVFIRDLFNNRMNTVFKLYYQAWAFLAIVVGFAIPLLLERARAAHPSTPSRIGVAAGTGLVAALFALTLLYPVGAVLDKTDDFSRSPNLDGIAFWNRFRPDEGKAIAWLSANVSGQPVIVEASGGSYRQEFGRVASMTGLPTLLGWEFHEQQWRGTFAYAGPRKPDIDAIYRSPNDQEVLAILAKYGAQYVFVGRTERDVYASQGADLNRFARFMDPVFRSGDVTIYKLRGTRAP